MTAMNQKGRERRAREVAVDVVEGSVRSARSCGPVEKSQSNLELG